MIHKPQPPERISESAAQALAKQLDRLPLPEGSSEEFVAGFEMARELALALVLRAAGMC